VPVTLDRAAEAPRPGCPVPARLRDESGIVVLGPLIVITVLVLGLGTLGYLKNREPHRVSLEGRELRLASAAVDVQYGGVRVRRIAPGSTVWVYPLDTGTVAVFEGRRVPNVLGFAPDSLLQPAVAR
jgi:hypothetical protein